MKKYQPPVPTYSAHFYRKLGTYKQLLKNVKIPQKLFDLWLNEMYKLGFVITEPEHPFYLWYLDIKLPDQKEHSLEFLYEFFCMSACLMFLEPPTKGNIDPVGSADA